MLPRLQRMTGSLNIILQKERNHYYAKTIQVKGEEYQSGKNQQQGASETRNFSRLHPSYKSGNQILDMGCHLWRKMQDKLENVLPSK